MQKTIALLALSFTLVSISSEALSQTSFFDDFNRPDSAVVGNGWTAVTGSVNGELVIRSGALSTANSASNAGIYRPFDFSTGVRVQANLTETSGFNGPNRYESLLTLFSGGDLESGLGIEIHRSDIGFANSGVTIRTASGIFATQFSPFQYGSQLGVDFRYQTNGLIDGTVTSGSDSFNFSFDASSIPVSELSGTNFAMRLDSGPLPNPTFDNVTISAIPEPETYALMLAGLGLLGFAAPRRQRKAVQA